MTQNNYTEEKNPIEIKSIEILANSNATEDSQKVIECIGNLLPINFNLKNINELNVMGGYNNPIKILKIKINKPEEIDNLILNLANLLCIEDKIKLLKEFYSRLNEKGAFYLRLRKDSLAKNEYILSTKSDVIRITIFLFNTKTGSQKKNNPDDIRKYLISKNILSKL